MSGQLLVAQLLLWLIATARCSNLHQPVNTKQILQTTLRDFLMFLNLSQHYIVCCRLKAKDICRVDLSLTIWTKPDSLSSSLMARKVWTASTMDTWLRCSQT